MIESCADSGLTISNGSRYLEWCRRAMSKPFSVFSDMKRFARKVGVQRNLYAECKLKISVDDLCENPKLIAHHELFKGILPFLKSEYFGRYSSNGSKMRVFTDIVLQFHPEDKQTLDRRGIDDAVLSETLEYVVGRELAINGNNYVRAFRRPCKVNCESDLAIKPGTVKILIGPLLYNGQSPSSIMAYKVKVDGKEAPFFHDMFFTVGNDPRCSIHLPGLEEKILYMAELGQRFALSERVFSSKWHIYKTAQGSPEDILTTKIVLKHRRDGIDEIEMTLSETATIGRVDYRVSPQRKLGMALRDVMKACLTKSKIKGTPICVEIGELQEVGERNSLHLGIDGNTLYSETPLWMARIDPESIVKLNRLTTGDEGSRLDHGSMELIYRGTPIYELFRLQPPPYVLECDWTYSTLILHKYWPRKAESGHSWIYKTSDPRGDTRYEVLNDSREPAKVPVYVMRGDTWYVVWDKQTLTDGDLILRGKKVYMAFLPERGAGWQ